MLDVHYALCAVEGISSAESAIEKKSNVGCNIVILDVHSLQLNVNPVQYRQEECNAVECWMYRKCSVVKCTVGYTALKCNVVTFGLQCPKVQCGVK